VVEFEVLERDGLARIGRLTTPHGPIETPALLPVVHPDPERQSVPIEEMVRRLGVGAVITSSYIVYRTPPLRERAEREGVHGLLGFAGPVMTDSGAFQQHAYGAVEVGPEEILRFQTTIGSDIATVLDLFTEPETPHETAEDALATTLARAEAARRERAGLLAVPVQGGAHDDLRARSAARASEIGDVLAIGGVVPLMERYRFPDLARVLLATRPSLSPGSPVHLFGTGHPMAFAWAALAGVDLFDSSAYHKFARRGDLLTVEGTVAIDDLREPVCRCFLCAELPLTEVGRLPTRDRERRIALHNLAASVEEIARVRQAIREGSLWELAERRAGAHPALRAGLATLRGRPEIFLPTEPESRRAFREIDPGSRERPAVIRFRHHLSVYGAGRPHAVELPRIPLRPDYLRYVPLQDGTGGELHWSVPSPLGPVPLELTDLYPVGPYLGEEEFLDPRVHLPPSAVVAIVRRHLEGRQVPESDWTDAWTRRQIAAILKWEYGRSVAAELAPRLRGDRSPRSGRLRGLVADGAFAFHVGVDGVPRPTFGGAKLLHGTILPGRHRIVVADDAVPFVRSGRSLFARFVVGGDPALVPGATALLVDRSDRLLAVGRLLLAPHEMPHLARGVAAWVTSHAKSPSEPLGDERTDEGEPERLARRDQTL
jgi:7-cyano-7-deazaguanine tRNA-ribosyltransferase